jgi:hypothetical protein
VIHLSLAQSRDDFRHYAGAEVERVSIEAARRVGNTIFNLQPTRERINYRILRSPRDKGWPMGSLSSAL